MPLLSLWNTNPSAVTALSVEQVVATAGDGKLKDESLCSQELREYLRQVDSAKLASYADYCLANAYPKSGLVLQDLVNEMGRRLDFEVENGRYQGTVGGIGFDGIWRSPEGDELIVEVKTTDAYRMSLETLANYQRKLREQGKVGATPSALIVVGREDTGELEAQVRGSRYAWDMRLISIDALAKLVALKESTVAGVTGRKIRSVLVPMEYTRVDGLVDVLFTAAKDVEATVDSEALELSQQAPTETGDSAGWAFTDPKTIDAQRQRILTALEQRDGHKLIKRSRALHWDGSHDYRVVCTVSKRYSNQGHARYWYAFHSAWREFLSEGQRAFVVLGCVDLDRAFAVPIDVLQRYLTALHTTPPDVSPGENGDEGYWHIKLVEPRPGELSLLLPKTGGELPLGEYELALG